MEQYFKYPRTPHFLWSPGATNDDKIMHDTTPFNGQMTVTTEKMDGENTSLYTDKYHARSLDSKDHPSRHWVKGLWGQIRHDIPTGWRICGENLYAKHSIFYDNLESYFMVFSVWNELNECLSWDDTVQITEMLGLKTVPVIDIGIYDEKKLKQLADTLDTEKREGYVTRSVKSFQYDNFTGNIAKWVREKHVTTSTHWMHDIVTPNKIKHDI